METETFFEKTNVSDFDEYTKNGSKDEPVERDKLLYGPNDVPPACVLIPVAFQQVVSHMAGLLVTTYLISDVVCAERDNPIRAKIFSTTIFMCGICTVLQSFFGIRLPIFQGPSSSFIVPLMTLRNTEAWKCGFQNDSSVISAMNSTQNVTTYGKVNDMNFGIMERLCELQGSLIAAALVETAIGCFGIVGVLIRFVGPITVSSTIILISLSLMNVVVEPCMVHWPLAMLSLLLVITFSLYMRDIEVPFPTGIKQKQIITTKLPVFKYLPVLLSVSIMWLICWILTLTNSLTDDPNQLAFQARTDAKDKIVASTNWFYFPYPGQFGKPKFNTAVFLGFTAAAFSSIVESVGDYFAASGVCRVPPPPRHAMNRGIFVEGLGSVLSGLYGAGHATTSYSTDVAIINMTKVASRYCMIGTGVLCIIVAFIGKVGAVLTTVPDPVLGGQMLLGLGLMTSIGISTLRFVDLSTSRNLIILGLSIYVGMVIPNYIAKYPESVRTGDSNIDQIIIIMLGNPMFFGTFISIILDNTVKGTLKERGLQSWAVGTNKPKDYHRHEQSETVYEFPWMNGIVEKYKFFKYLPFIQKPKK